MKKEPRFREGDLVQSRPYTGAQGALMYPSHPGIVKRVVAVPDEEASSYVYTVVWFIRSGLKTANEFEDKIKYFRED
jgi:hypothetical protein